MGSPTQHPLASIEAGLLSDEPVASLLRKVIILGGHASAPELRRWASAELNGYPDDAELPDYRKLSAGLAVDAVAGNTHATGLPISPWQVKAALGIEIAPELHLRQPIAELQQLAQGESESLKFSPGWGPAALAAFDRGRPFQQTYAVYWQVHSSSVAGVIDRVMTRLADFVSEVRSVVPTSTEATTAEALNTAVHVVISGGVNQFSLGAHSPIQGTALAVKLGDLSSLRSELLRLGVEDAEWQELLRLMETDEEADGTPFRGPGPRTKGWVVRVAERIGRAGGQITIGATGGALGDLMMEGLKAYYGLS